MNSTICTFICALIAFMPAIGAKEINLKGSSLAEVVDAVYEGYASQNLLHIVPEGYKTVYEAMKDGDYIFDDQELTELIPEWELLYYYITG